MLKLVLRFALAALVVTSVSAQNKFPRAIERSGAAGRIVETLALLPGSSMPKELMDKAQAVGVFPKVEKETSLFSQFTYGHGVICARSEEGWTVPAYYEFGGGGFGNPFADDDTYGVILLFMTREALDSFEKGGVKLKNERKALEGPVGNITDEQRKALEGVHVLAYAYFNGRLKGISYGKSFWKSFSLNPDNKINKPLYGVKGREVLAGKKIDPATLPAGITDYQNALQKYYSATN